MIPAPHGQTGRVCLMHSKSVTALTSVITIWIGATVVRLEKERVRPQGDTAYYFMPFGAMAADKGVTQPFRPVNLTRFLRS